MSGPLSGPRSNLSAAAESSSDEHFSDASEGRPGQPDRSEATSPIPVTRVERVDDQPSYGEVPGTIDQRLVVDLRFFGYVKPNYNNHVAFSRGCKDEFGMPQVSYS